jgi:DNA polymerase V
MSRRVHDILAALAPASEEYSIDESFLRLDGIDDLAGYARHIRRTVRQWTGIPVSIGIGPTKVLAKVANHIAKKQPQHGGVFVLPADYDAYLRLFRWPICGALDHATRPCSKGMASRLRLI